MGTSTDAYLIYGYDLGNSEEWKIEGLGKYGEWRPNWINVDTDDEDQDEPDWPDAVAARLLAVAGFTEEWTPGARANGYYERKMAAEQQVGVELESHCSGEYPMYVLSAHKVRARRGDVETLDLAVLQALVERDDLDGKLARACEALSIRPTQEKPMWLLCSYWG